MLQGHRGLHPRGKGPYWAFTLLELLIVIGIIAGLLAILVPALAAARRRALALACPIAYVAADFRVYICDPKGDRHLLVSDEKCSDRAGPVWSPDCKRLAFVAGSNRALCIADPGAGTSKLIMPSGGATYFQCPAWIDCDNVIFYSGWPGPSDVYQVDVRSGAVKKLVDVVAKGMGTGSGQFFKDPHILGGYVTCEAERYWAPTTDVYIRDLDFNLKRVLWQDASNDRGDFDAKPDWIAERVAWTRERGSNTVDGPRSVAYMDLEHDPGPPRTLGDGFDGATFLDWTPDGRILAIVQQSGKRSLVIMDLSDTVVRALSTPYGIGSDGNNTTFGGSWARPRRF